MFLEQQISILEWFLKDQDTRRLKISFDLRNKLHLKYIQIENSCFKL